VAPQLSDRCLTGAALDRALQGTVLGDDARAKLGERVRRQLLEDGSIGLLLRPI
jgi:hypothetical protein